MRAIAQLKPAIPVTGYIPAVENMLNGNAQRPGDIVTTLSGKTVEVLNTDAEGRLILADAITYANRNGAHPYRGCRDSDRRDCRSAGPLSMWAPSPTTRSSCGAF